jgi:peptide/nickel transport system substrate-binding protein
LQLLKEAGYAHGFDAGDIIPVPPWTAMAEAVASYLGAVGIKVQVRSMERPAMFAAWRGKTLQGVILGASGANGNAATRLENYVIGGGSFVYGSHPDIDGLFSEQVNETNPRVRQQVLHKIQQLVHERAMFIPLVEPAFLNGSGARVEHHGLNVIAGFAYSAPYEDLRLKKK